MITPQLKYMIAEKLSNEKLITKLSIISNSWNDICHNVIWDKREPIYVHKSPFRMNSFQIDNYNDITINVVNKWWSNVNYAIYTGDEKSPLYNINDDDDESNNNLGLGLLLSEDLQRQEEIFHKKRNLVLQLIILVIIRIGIIVDIVIYNKVNIVIYNKVDILK